ncbi:unnamed protein product [Owenia fusiformis]|uniref:Ribonuclease P protein subunit p20 n=1 Tax=Owenia fusiformis TaxID=6347 RepID=A0A8J1UJC1_OWEFU|nr:unnamed protein product [Owenia fusiformis]
MSSEKIVTSPAADSTVAPPGVEAIGPEEYTVRKRLPKQMPRRTNDIYVTKKTNFNCQLKRCKNLLDTGKHCEIYIHGLGNAVNRAVNLALKLKAESAGTLDTAVNTSTVELIDDLEPNTDDVEPGTQTRNSSAVHIKVFSVTK